MKRYGRTIYWKNVSSRDLDMLVCINNNFFFNLSYSIDMPYTQILMPKKLPVKFLYIVVSGTNVFPLHLLFSCLWCRELSFIIFRLYSVLLLEGVEKRNTWEEGGLIGLEGWRSFSRRENGNSGYIFPHANSYVVKLCLWFCLDMFFYFLFFFGPFLQ